MPNKSSVILTKLHRPPISKDIIDRTGLVQKLNKNNYKSLTLVSAPTGYGKSILISQWLASFNPLNVWISLDEDFNDKRTFLTYLIAGLNLVFPKYEDALQDIIDSTELPPNKDIAKQILNFLDSLGKELFIVLDDYYFITNHEIHALLKQIIKHTPHKVHFIIITRRDPAIGLSLMRANDTLHEIGVGDLCFSNKELVLLNETLLQINMSPVVAQNLLEKTEGWIVGLRIALRILEDADNAEEAIAGISGNIHLISDYLLAEVLSKQPKEFQIQMLKASMFNRFCESLLVEVFEKDEQKVKGESVIFRRLITANVFCVHLDNEKKWLRYHHLFQDLLKKELVKTVDDNEIKEVQNSASVWFENNGYISEAIDYAIEAKNYDRALAIIKKNWLATFNQGLWYNVENWVLRLPKKVVDKSTMLSFIQAWVLCEKHQISNLPILLRKMESKYKDFSNEEKGYWSFFQCLFSYYSGDLEGACALINKAIELIPIKQLRFYYDAHFWRCMVLQSLGRQEEAIKKNKKMLRQVGMGADNVVLARLYGEQAFVYAFSANLRGLRIAARKLNNIEGLNGYAKAFGYYFTASSCWWGGDLKNVAESFESVIKHRYQSNQRQSIDAYIAKALALQHLKKEEEANNVIQNMLDFAGKIKEPDIYAATTSGQARLAILQGKLDAAINWLQSTESHPIGVLEWQWIEQPLITRCRVLIAKGTPNSLDAALQFLTESRTNAKLWHNKLREIEIIVLQAIALKLMAKDKQAMECLKEGVVLAEKGNWLMPFIESGHMLTVMLESIKKEGIAVEFINDIFKKIVDNTKILSTQTPINNKYISNTSAKLSPREIEVLKLVALNLKNKEIGQKLYVTEATIKRHVYNMFKKLEVNNRLALSNKAKQFGLTDADQETSY